MNDETVQKTMQKIWIGEDAMYEIVRGDAGRVFGWGRRLSFHADDDCYILVPAKDAEIERLRTLVAQVQEAIAILENGTDYERLHVSGILRQGISSAHAAPETTGDHQLGWLKDAALIHLSQDAEIARLRAALGEIAKSIEPFSDPADPPPSHGTIRRWWRVVRHALGEATDE